MKDTPFQVTANKIAFDIKPSDAQMLDIVSVKENNYHILKNNNAYKVEVESVNHRTKTVTMRINGNPFTTNVVDYYDRLIDKLGMKVGGNQVQADVKAPMPGLVIEVAVEIGQEVKKGDKVLILEAMKMENVLKAPADSVVESIHVSKGNAVEKGQILIKMK